MSQRGKDSIVKGAVSASEIQDHGPPVTEIRICLNLVQKRRKTDFVNRIIYEGEAANLLRQSARLVTGEGGLADSIAWPAGVAIRYAESGKTESDRVGQLSRLGR